MHVPQSPDHIHMAHALTLALQAAQSGEVPIGALVINQWGQVIGTGHNQVESLSTQAAHAELIALAQAGKTQGDWRLHGCTMYVTLQPCYMCWAAIALSRIHRLVYAARSPVYGFDADRVAPILGAYQADTLYTQEGPYTKESQQLLDDFFIGQRCAASRR